MNRILCLILIASAGWLTGCDQTVQDYVKDAKNPNYPVATTTPIPSNDNERGIKVSPGHAQVSGSHYGANMTVTPTQHTVVGTHYRAELSINQQRQ